MSPRSIVGEKLTILKQGGRINNKYNLSVAFDCSTAQAGQKVKRETKDFDKGFTLTEEVIHL